ncbi:18011_t:CDS:2, partial [Entrophospora sp. SA101]
DKNVVVEPGSTVDFKVELAKPVTIEEKKNFVIREGLVLTGNEIKSLRSHQASIGEAYVSPQQKELYVINMNIATYKYSYAGDLAKTDTRKKRKLLLKRREINKLIGTMKAKSYVLIPLQLFTNDK